MGSNPTTRIVKNFRPDNRATALGLTIHHKDQGEFGIAEFIAGTYPACSKHGAMNKVSPDAQLWRCLNCNIGAEWPDNATWGEHFSISACRVCGTTHSLTKHHLISKAKIKLLREAGKPVPEHQLTVDLCRRDHGYLHHGQGSAKTSWKHGEGKKVRIKLRAALTDEEVAYIVEYAGKDYLRRVYPQGINDHVGSPNENRRKGRISRDPRIPDWFEAM